MKMKPAEWPQVRLNPKIMALLRAAAKKNVRSLKGEVHHRLVLSFERKPMDKKRAAWVNSPQSWEDVIKYGKGMPAVDIAEQIGNATKRMKRGIKWQRSPKPAA